MATTPERIADQIRARLWSVPGEGWASTKTVLRWFWSGDRSRVRAVLLQMVAAGELEMTPCVYRGWPGTRYRILVQDLTEELAALGLSWASPAGVDGDRAGS